MIRIGLLGYAGRMGQLIADEIAQRDDCVLVGGTVRHVPTDAPKTQGLLITPHADEVIALSDVIIDFSVAEATPAHIQKTLAHKKPVVVGVTGLGAQVVAQMKEAANTIPLLYAANTSVSLAALKPLVTLAAKLLADFDYDIAITDEHHRLKKDAPSGTAKALGDAALKGNGGAKAPTYAAIRAGHIVGEHEVLFAGQGETIRLRHSVTDRRIFARGALEAALWLVRQPHGFYGMDDMLGLGR